MLQLSVIIVNYNVRHFLEQCLHSLNLALQGIEAEVWVVDNASSDGSLPFLKPVFPMVHWVQSEENLGFSKANNLALAKATGQYVLFLNPDTLLPEDCLQKCMGFLEHQKDAGALGIRMVDGSGRYLPESKRGYPGVLTSFFKLAGFASLFPKSPLFARYYLGHLSPIQNHPVEVLAGAFMLVRRQVLEVTGGFDERFFMYGEDIDLSFQINNTPLPGGNGFWKTWYFAETAIVHFKGESTQKGSKTYVRTFYRAMQLFVRKHYSPLRAFVYSIFIYIAMIFRSLAGIFPGKKAATADEGPVWVAGTENDFEAVCRLLAGSERKSQTPVPLSPMEEATDGRPTLDAWQQNRRKVDSGTIIFCAGPQLPMQRILKYLQPNGKINYLFHYAGSSSVVGSNNSNRSGEIIAGKSK